MASINVKVPTSKVIELIENKIESLNKAIKSYPDDIKKYEADYKKFNEEMVKFALKQIKNGTNYSADVRSYSSLNKSISINFSVSADVETPKAPERPADPNNKTWVGRSYLSPLDRLEQTLKVLKLSSQETVSASTYSAVIDLI
jgi:hypothetical protein